MGKIKKTTKARPKTSEAGQAGRRNRCREARRFRTKTEILNKRSLRRWQQSGMFSKSYLWKLFTVFLRDEGDFKVQTWSLFYKQTKNLAINSPVHRKIPAKIVSVDCIHVVNGLSTACQSEGKVSLPVKTENRVFAAIILYFSVIFFRWRIMLRIIHLPDNQHFNKMVGLNVHGNLN